MVLHMPRFPYQLVTPIADCNMPDDLHVLMHIHLIIAPQSGAARTPAPVQAAMAAVWPLW